MKCQTLVGALGLALLLVWGAGAQTPAPVQQVNTIPSQATTQGGNASGTVASTGPFQLVFAASPARHGCTIYYTGSHTLYITEGLATGASTTGNSVGISAGQSYYCQFGGVVLTGQINVGGTSGDAFYAAQY